MRKPRWISPSGVSHTARYQFGLAALALLALPAHFAYAQWQEHGIPVYTHDGQSRPAAISDGLGGAIIVTEDQRPTIQGIFAQRISGPGMPLWNPSGVPVGTAGNGQYVPALVGDGVGGAYVAWQDNRYVTIGVGSSIYVQHLDASGQPLWVLNGIRVNVSTSGQSGVAIVGDGAGGAIVCWLDYPSNLAQVVAQRLSSAGALLWGAGVPLTTDLGAEGQLAAVEDGVGGMVVAWAEHRGQADDIFAQRISANGLIQWGPGGVGVCTDPGDQMAPRIAPDNAGGAYIAWSDSRGPVHQVFAQHADANGASTWAVNGILPSAVGGRMEEPALCPDGTGGLAIAWTDWRNGDPDIYAQRLDGDGARLWGPQDLALCSARATQSKAILMASASGGVLAAWQDFRQADPDIYAQRFDLTGAPQWSTDGVALGTTNLNAGPSWLVQDESGGAILGWLRNQAEFSQRILADGSPGYFLSLHAMLESVNDEPNDQGSWVQLEVTAALGDVSKISPNVMGYGVWRRALAATAQTATIASPSAGIGGVVEAARIPGSILSAAQAAAAGFPLGSWESLGLYPATQSGSYTFLAPTHEDSTVDGIAQDVFVVSVHTTNPLAFTVSEPESGYSVDNLAPPIPTPFAATFGSSSNVLHWAASRVRDLGGYRLYRGAGSDFVPSSSNLIAATRDTGFVDIPGATYYKLAAIDIHGNLGRFAVVSPDQPTATLALSSASMRRRTTFVWSGTWRAARDPA